MAKVLINAAEHDVIKRYEGEYDLDKDVTMTSLEWFWVRKIADYLPLTVDEGFAGDDPQLFLALAVIAMHRAGKIREAEAVPVAELFRRLPHDPTAEGSGPIRIDFTGDEDAEKAELAEEAQADHPEA